MFTAGNPAVEKNSGFEPAVQRWTVGDFDRKVLLITYEVQQKY